MMFWWHLGPVYPGCSQSAQHAYRAYSPSRGIACSSQNHPANSQHLGACMPALQACLLRPGAGAKSHLNQQTRTARSASASTAPPTRPWETQVCMHSAAANHIVRQPYDPCWMQRQPQAQAAALGHVPQAQLPEQPLQTCQPLYCCLLSAGSSSTGTWYQRAHKVVQQRVSRPVNLRKGYGQVIESDCNIDHPCDIAESSAAAGRNRYCDVLPYDHNRWASCFSSHQ